MPEKLCLPRTHRDHLCGRRTSHHAQAVNLFSNSSLTRQRRFLQIICTGTEPRSWASTAKGLTVVTLMSLRATNGPALSFAEGSAAISLLQTPVMGLLRGYAPRNDVSPASFSRPGAPFRLQAAATEGHGAFRPIAPPPAASVASGRPQVKASTLRTRRRLTRESTAGPNWTPATLRP